MPDEPAIFEPGEVGWYSEVSLLYNFPPDWAPFDDQPDKWSERQRADESAAKRARTAEKNLAGRKDDLDE